MAIFERFLYPHAFAELDRTGNEVAAGLLAPVFGGQDATGWRPLTSLAARHNPTPRT